MLLNSAPLNTVPINSGASGGSAAALAGVRQFEADFETPTHHVLGTSTTRRPDAVSLDYLTAFTPGPIAIEDTSAGLEVRRWYVRAGEDQKLWIARSNAAGTGWEAEQLLHDYAYSGPSEIVELDCCFDEEGRPVVVAERPSGDDDAPQVWIYAWNETFEDYLFSSVSGPGRTPRCVLDLFPVSPDPDVCPPELDVQIFYMKPGDGLTRLQQDEDFATPHSTPVTDDENVYLEDVYPTASRRMQMVYSQRHPDTGTYELKRIASKPFKAALLSRPSFSQDLAFDLAWYRGQLWHNPPESEVTEDYTFRIIVVEECDYLEFQTADTIPSGPQANSGGIWSASVFSTAPPINEGGFRTFTVSVTHGAGTMSPNVFRVRAKKTIGAKTCYSPWRYWISAIEGDPDDFPIDVELVNCDRDAVVCFACSSFWLHENNAVIRPPNYCEESPVSGHACACGLFAAGWTPSSPFLWVQDWGVRVRSHQSVSFSDNHQSFNFPLIGKVFKSASSGAGGTFQTGTDQEPIFIPEGP